MGRGEGEASSGAGSEVGRTSVEDVEGAQQGSVWEGRQQPHYALLKCLCSTYPMNDIKPLEDLSLS